MTRITCAVQQTRLSSQMNNMPGRVLVGVIFALGPSQFTLIVLFSWCEANLTIELRSPTQENCDIHVLDTYLLLLLISIYHSESCRVIVLKLSLWHGFCGLLWWPTWPDPAKIYLTHLFNWIVTKPESLSSTALLTKFQVEFFSRTAAAPRYSAPNAFVECCRHTSLVMDTWMDK